MMKLNPSNDWLPYNNDSLEKSDDEGEQAAKGSTLSETKQGEAEHKYPHGSEHYGHVQTREHSYHSHLTE